jgi:hypothetical protein
VTTITAAPAPIATATINTPPGIATATVAAIAESAVMAVMSLIGARIPPDTRGATAIAFMAVP